MPDATSGRALRSPRTFALLSTCLLVASYLGILYHVVDVTGSVPLFAGVVLAAALLATAAARLLSPGVALAVASLLLAGGLGAYVSLVPPVSRALSHVGRYVGDLLDILTGRSVLLFLSADVWATAVTPAAVFLPWYLALRERYDAAALAGGVALGFFVLTGDAGYGQTLLGVAGAFGLLGFGRLVRADADWSRVRRLGLWIVVAALATRAVSAADPFPADRYAGTAGLGSASDASSDGGINSLEGSLVSAGDRVSIQGSIRLTGRPRFTIAADEPALWHAGAYDRYTGEGWVRTGGDAPLTGALSAPPGETTTLRQRVTVESSVETMPAAWKPTRVTGAPESARRTSLEGLRPGRPFEEGEEYVVESRMPDRSAARLRAAGMSYPESVADRFTRLPSSTPSRVQTLGDRLAEDASTPYDVAVSVERWLEATKEYSLTVPEPGSNAAATFLFEMTAGYCVHFATAMTVLLRTQGIPARFAVGYTPGERIDERSWLVRGLHSHAWVEAYFPDVGWVPFDPTPAGPRQAAEQAALGEGNVDSGVSGVSGNETTSTVNATTTGTDEPANGSEATARQTTTTRAVAAGGAEDGDRGLPAVDDTVDGAGGSAVRTILADRDRVAALAGGAAVVIGAYQTGLFERGYRAAWLRYQPRSDDPAADVERAAARASVALGRRYRERREGETLRAYVDALDLTPAERDRAERLLARYERARYADDVTPEAADEAVALADELVRGE